MIVREAGVASCSVAVPEINEDVFKRLSSGHAEDTDIESERNSGLSLSHVLSESLGAWTDIRTFGDLGN